MERGVHGAARAREKVVMFIMHYEGSISYLGL